MALQYNAVCAFILKDRKCPVPAVARERRREKSQCESERVQLQLESAASTAAAEGTVKSFEKSSQRKARLDHLQFFPTFARKSVLSLSPPPPPPPIPGFDPSLPVVHGLASPPEPLSLSHDAGPNIGVGVSLGDNRGLQFPDHIQLHHPHAELQEQRECAGRGFGPGQNLPPEGEEVRQGHLQFRTRSRPK
uniref:Uncharacterized protein n=1 Tax=Knipowitschia caucasica TaxID=637954 RepID=A0AAV2L5L0_KNICA